MKLLTRETDYAIKALILLLGQDTLVTVSMLEKELAVSRPLLRRILQQLAKNGVLRSYRGRNGGFKAQKKASEIRLIDIMQIFQGNFSIHECFFHKHICPNKPNCSLRKVLLRIEAQVEEELKSLTLKKIIES